MNFFQAHIASLIQMVETGGSRILAVAVLQYPLYQIRCRTEEIAEESTRQLDVFILRFIALWESASVEDVSLMLGLSKNVIRSRMREMKKSKYVESVTDKYALTERGALLLANEAQIVKCTMYREFVVDGVTLKPTKILESSSTPRPRNLHTILIPGRFEVGDDRVRGSDFRPDIVHTLPGDSIVEGLLAVPIDERKSVGIFPGLLDILDYEPVKCTHPLAIVFIQDAEGVVHREIFDCCGPRAYAVDEAVFHPQFVEAVNCLSLGAERLAGQGKGQPGGKIQLRNSWHMGRSEFSLAFWDESKVSQIIREEWDVSAEVMLDVKVSNYQIVWTISSPCVAGLVGRTTAKELIALLYRKKAWIHQHESSGVWLVFVELLPGDDHTRAVLELYGMIRSDTFSLASVRAKWKKTELRKMLLELEEHNRREELDVKEFIRPAGKRVEVAS